MAKRDEHVAALTAQQRQASVAVLEALSETGWDQPTPC